MKALLSDRNDRTLAPRLLFGVPLAFAASVVGFLLYRSGSQYGRRGARNPRVRDLMSDNPGCCRSDTPLREVAEMMVANDCGEIPVCDDSRRPIGVVTDRDIVCRLLAKGHDPLRATAKDCMSRPVIMCTPDVGIDECADLLERHQIRRAPVVDAAGVLCGMIAQADLARKGPSSTAAEVVQKVSEPNLFASAVGGR